MLSTNVPLPRGYSPAKPPPPRLAAPRGTPDPRQRAST